jgi:hypothetical protein
MRLIITHEAIVLAKISRMRASLLRKDVLHFRFSFDKIQALFLTAEQTLT